MRRMARLKTNKGFRDVRVDPTMTLEQVKAQMPNVAYLFWG